MKKRIVSLVLALAMLVMLMPVAFADSGYTDTDGHWAEAAIDRWSSYGIVGGYPDSTFKPSNSMSRAEVARVFANLLGLTQKADISRYTDVNVGAWYYDDIAMCVAAGILNGTSPSTMEPEEHVTREELFTMFGRALGVPPKASADKEFVDSDEVSAWAAGYINALADMGVVNGIGGNVLDPGSDIDRAAVMTVLDNAISEYVNTNGATVGSSDGIVLVVADNVTVTGSLEALVVADSANTVTVASGGAVNSVTIVGPQDRVVFTGSARASQVVIPATAEGASVVVNAGTQVGAVTVEADNVTLSGNGTVEAAVVSGNNTAVNTDGTNLTVAAGTTGVTENGKAVAGGTTVETEFVTVAPPTHVHSYVETNIMAADDNNVVAAVRQDCSCGISNIFPTDAVSAQVNPAGDYYVSLEKAMEAAEDGGQVVLLKDYTLDSQLTIDKAITLFGNNKAITRSKNEAGTDQSAAAGILVTADGVEIRNLTVVGPNSNNTESNWDSGEYGIKVYNATGVTLNRVTVKGANAGILVSSSTVTLSGAITVTGNEWGGIEVSKSSNLETVGVLNINGATVVCEDKGIPAIWIDGYNSGTNSGGTVNGAESFTTMIVDGGNQLYYFTDSDLAVSDDPEDNSGVSEVDGVLYASVVDALAAAGEEDTVTLLSDAAIPSDVTVNVSENVTLDLNENEITTSKTFYF